MGGLSRRLPTTLIGGYLGAGKTTLINRMLRMAGGRRLAVLVNDFGDLNIDADLIERAGETVIEISGGCICCSLGGDLGVALMDLEESGLPLDHVLIETSGVALPAAVAADLGLNPACDFQGVVVVADATQAPRLAQDRFVGEVVRAQLNAADLILLSRGDIASEHDRERTRALVLDCAPKARLGDVRIDADEVSVVLAPAFGPRRDSMFAVPAAEAMFRSWRLSLAGPVDALAVGVALTDPQVGLERAKGVLWGADGSPVLLQVASGRFELTPSSQAAATLGELVCIGGPGADIEAALRFLRPLGFSLHSGNATAGLDPAD